MLTVAQVAERLGLTAHQVYRRLSRGDIASVMGGMRQQQYFVRPDDLQQYIDAGQPLSVPKRDRMMMTVPEVARVTGFTRETVRRLCYEGQLEFVRGPSRNGHLRIPRHSVNVYMTQSSLAV